MAYRFPLYYDRSNGSLKNMTQAQLAEIVNAVRYEWGAAPYPGLGVVIAGGSMDSLTETRLQAGTSVTHVSSFQDAPDTSIVTTTFDKVSQSHSGVGTSEYTGNLPCYYDASGIIKHMSLQDVKDTFIYPAIVLLTDGTDQPGTHKITTSTTLAGHTVDTVNGAMYIDTRADASAYTAGSIPEAQDQPTNITSYYLAKVNNIANPTHQYPMTILPDGDLAEYKPATFRALLQQVVRRTAFTDAGYKIRYGYFDGSTHTATGANMGTGMTDTRLNNQATGSVQIGGDDYRTQDFPAGTSVTINTTFLRIRRD